MKPSNSSGADGISIRLIKENLRPMEKSILNMVNQSIHQGIFPNILKTSRVIPILKPGKPPASYRPINLLPAFSKESHISTVSKVY